MYNIEQITQWLENYRIQAGAQGFVIGISGGKDSAVAAALLVRASGADRVTGIIIPNGHGASKEESDAQRVCKHLSIETLNINIGDMFKAFCKNIPDLSPHTLTNIPPRLRMTTLYAVAQEKNYLVCGTGNYSERYIGYCTKWGDTASDINPLAHLLSDEVVELGRELGVPEDIISKPPADGLTGKTDEENIGFTYTQLNNFIRTGTCEDPEVQKRIERMHKIAMHKVMPIPILDSSF